MKFENEPSENKLNLVSFSATFNKDDKTIKFACIYDNSDFQRAKNDFRSRLLRNIDH